MPRTVRKTIEPSPTPHPDLIAKLVAELGRTAGGGQPRVEEEHFPATGLIRAVVLWDEWDRVPDEERVAVVRAAYTEVEDAVYADRLALVVALTFPEAYDSGMLPHCVVPLVRHSDPITPEQCEAAMIAEGASTLRGRPFLAFATLAEAEECRSRLAAATPEAAEMWNVRSEPYRSAGD